MRPVGYLLLDEDSSYGCVRLAKEYRSLDKNNWLDVADATTGIDAAMAALYNMAASGDAGRYAKVVRIIAKSEWTALERQFIAACAAS